MENGTADKTIELMAEQEALISRLYDTYSRRFTEEAGFWRTLAEDEDNHHQWLAVLAENLQKGDLRFIQRKFPIQAVKSSVDYVRSLIEDADKHTLISALSYALDLENSLIEKNYFEIFDADSSQMKEVFSKLKGQTAEHRSMINRKYDEVRKKAGIT